MFWFLHKLARLNLETNAIDDLEREAEWLSEACWLLEKGRLLCLDAVITAHGHPYGVRMTYPTVFPMSPPTVLPRRAKERWSGHQFGPGGELCLEWGPDNWHPEVTGAEMLKSAFKLLDAENPRGGDGAEPVPSRHSSTLGQELRRNRLRLCITPGLVTWADALPSGTVEEIDITLVVQRESLLALIRRVGSAKDAKWTEQSSPGALEDAGKKVSGFLIKTSLSDSLPPIKRRSDIQRFLDQHGFELPSPGFKGPNELDLLAFSHADGKIELIWILDNHSCLRFQTVCLQPNRGRQRLSPDFEQLGSKRVGIVGLGSVGSKVALSLGRSGVRHFVLIDDDVFLPENVTRHTLDWRNVGEHKVDGVARQLELLAPAIDVKTHKIRLSGQESTGSVAGAFNSLTACDLVVDGTADPRTFNQLAALADQFAIHLIWMEVFAGGIGGLVARHRPQRDPAPHTMRSVLNQVLAENEAPMDIASGSYAAQGEDDRVVVASNADVGVIADHSVRMAIDALLDSEQSSFSHSIYLIGLMRSWLFEAPFHTIPIAVDEAIPGANPREELSDEARSKALSFLERTIARAHAQVEDIAPE